jgi:catechol 2,3-dioxygenase-like lactoylglutathione lyase family enzyme
MDLQCLDHVHFSVSDLARAKRILGPFLRGQFVDDYGGPEVNAYGGWNTSGGDFIQVIDPEKPVFGGGLIPSLGILSVSFRVADIDAGIAQAKALGLKLRSRIGSEDIGLGKNVVQAQFVPEVVSGLPLELIEHQLPGEYVSLTDAAVDHVEYGVAEALEPAAEALERIFGSAFEPEIVDTQAGLRTRLHRRLGIRLSSPVASGSDSAEASSAWQPGLRAIGFHCTSLAQAIETAKGEGLVVARDSELDSVREVEFLPFANTIVRLVERTN